MLFSCKKMWITNSRVAIIMKTSILIKSVMLWLSTLLSTLGDINLTCAFSRVIEVCVSANIKAAFFNVASLLNRQRDRGVSVAAIIISTSHKALKRSNWSIEALAVRQCVWPTMRCGWPSKRGINHQRVGQLLSARRPAPGAPKWSSPLWVAYKSHRWVVANATHDDSSATKSSKVREQCSTVVDALYVALTAFSRLST